MSNLTGTLRNSGDNFRQETIHRAAVHTHVPSDRESEFLRFLNRYEHRGTDNHSYFGQVDVSHMNERDAERVRNAKMARIDERASQFQQHPIQQSKTPLREYTLDIPKYLPERIATKRVALNTQADQAFAEQVRRAVSSGQYLTPNFTQVFATQQQNNELVIYFEYQNTLADDIAARREQYNPYHEELLWKLMYNLATASSRLSSSGQALEDIRPSQVCYNDFQVSVLPVNVNRNSFVANFQSGRPVFFSEEQLQQLNGNVQRSQQLRASSLNESFQIGLTVLCAGLLRQESEISVCANRQFNQQQLEVLLDHFGRIYSKQDRLLVWFLRQFLLSQSRVTPAEVASILSPTHDYVVFLDQQFKNQVRAHLNQTGLINTFSTYESQNRANVVSENMWDDYPAHFHSEIMRRNFQREEARIRGVNQQADLQRSQTETQSIQELERIILNNNEANAKLVQYGREPIRFDYRQYIQNLDVTRSQIIMNALNEQGVTASQIVRSQPQYATETVTRTSHIHGGNSYIRQSGQVMQGSHIHYN